MKQEKTEPAETISRQAPLDRVLGRDGFSPDLPDLLARKPAALTLGLRLLMFMFKGVKIGSLDVTLPNGERRSFAGTEPGPHGMLNIRHPRLVGLVLKYGEVGFGEAYLEGYWDSPDLAALLAVMHVNEPHYKGPYEKNP